MENRIPLFAFVALLMSVFLGLGCPGSPRNEYDGPEPAGAVLDITGEDFGNLPVNTTGKIVSFYIRNLTAHGISDLEVHGLSAPFSFHGGGFPGNTGTCGRDLPPASTCSIALEVGTYNGLGAIARVIEIRYRIGKWAKDNKATIRGEFTDSPRLQVANVDFGGVDVGLTETKALELRNLSSYANIDNLVVTLHVGSGFTLVNPNHCHMIGPQGTCKIDVEFSPKITSDLNETVDISYEVHGQRKSEQVRFIAQGNSLDHIDLSNSQNFGNVTQIYNKNGRITLFLNRHASNSIDVSNISLDPAQLVSAGLRQNNLASTCDTATLNAFNNCVFVLDTINPIRATTNQNDNIDIAYKLGNVAKKLRATVNGQFLIYLPTVTGQIFGSVNVVAAGAHQVVVTVNNPVQNSVGVAGNFAVAGLGMMANGVNLVRAATSTCGAGPLLSGNSCNIMIDATPPAQAVYVINHPITITYRDARGNNISEVVTLQGRIDVAPGLLNAAGQNFGAVNVVAGTSRQVSITLTNPLGNGSATSFSILGLGLTANNVNLSRHASSTCPSPLAAGSVLAANSCTMVIEARAPAVGNYIVNQNITVRYRIGGQSYNLAIPLVGNLTVTPGGGGAPPPPPLGVGAPLANFVTYTGTNPFPAPPGLLAGASFDVTLTLTNTHPTASGNNFDMDRYDPAGTALMGWVGYFIQLSPRSSCMAGPALAPGQSCTMVLEITPDPNRPKNLGAGGRKFKLKYKDSNNNDHEEDFNLIGLWNFLPPPPPPAAVPAKPPQSPSNGAPPHIFKAHLTSHAYFDFSTRQLKANPQANLIPFNLYPSAKYLQYYPPALWNLIPNRTFYNTPTHMTWGFTPPPGTQRTDLTKLKDIVADRIVDPVTGVRYVKLYHGTTSDTIIAFQTGATVVAFNRAEVDVLGQGWYLASSANDSKGYGCMRYNARKKAATGPFSAILLVVGIEENDFIAGKESGEELSKGKWPPASTGVASYPNPGHYPQSEWGKPFDPAVYFRRNDGMHNQFVFFENVKPYLKIFEIVELGNHFGRTNGSNDHDGESSIPFGPNYQCDY